MCWRLHCCAPLWQLISPAANSSMLSVCQLAADNNYSCTQLQRGSAHTHTHTLTVYTHTVYAPVFTWTGLREIKFTQPLCMSDKFHVRKQRWRTQKQGHTESATAGLTKAARHTLQEVAKYESLVTNITHKCTLSLSLIQHFVQQYRSQMSFVVRGTELCTTVHYTYTTSMYFY